MSGTFFCVGVGPGDPELLTWKAISVIEQADVLVIPVSDKSLEKPVYTDKTDVTMQKYLVQCMAYQIVKEKLPGLREKEKLYLPMPMIKDKERLKQIHDKDTALLLHILDREKTAAFITLGDPSVYSTCLYIQKRVKKKGYPTELVPGVPSFCAAAARLNKGLAENKEQIHIIPASYGVEEALCLPGTKVLMKAGRKMPEVKQAVKRCGMEMEMVENCGMKGERIYTDIEAIPDEAGYYSLLIIKEKKG